MSILLTCPTCGVTLRLAEAMAGRQGACRECGASFRVPKNAEANRPPEERPIGKASLDEITQELGRRGLTAIISVVGGADGTSRGADHYTTEPMDEQRLKRLFSAWSGVPTPALEDSARPDSPLEENPPASTGEKGDEPADDDFAFKGDALGCTLAEFRMRHEREAPGRRRRMPWCSDETPDAATRDLMSESWHAGVGIVHARIDLPEENASPTIANVATELVIYQFVDGKLFQITGFFSPEGFSKIHAALRERYGEPQHESDSPRVLQWWKDNTSLELINGRIHPLEPGVFRFYHDELLAEASERKPPADLDL